MKRGAIAEGRGVGRPGLRFEGAFCQSPAIIPPTPCGTGLKRPFAWSRRRVRCALQALRNRPPEGTAERSACRSAGGRRTKADFPKRGLLEQVRRQRRGRDAVECPERMGRASAGGNSGDVPKRAGQGRGRACVDSGGNRAAGASRGGASLVPLFRSVSAGLSRITLEGTAGAAGCRAKERREGVHARRGAQRTRWSGQDADSA